MVDFTKVFKVLKLDVEKLVQDQKYDKILEQIEFIEQKYNNENVENQNQISYLDLFKNSLTGIGIVRKGGEILDCNPILFKMLGFSSLQELKKHNINELYADLQERIILLKELYKKGYVIEYKIKVKTKNGDIITALVNANLIQTQQDPFVIVNFLDITQQEKTTEELKILSANLENRVEERTQELNATKDKFKKLSELSPAGISIQRKNKYYYVNTAWSDITGYDISEINKIGPFDIIHPDMHNQVNEITRTKLRNEGASINYHLKIITKQDKIKWLDISITTLIYENQFATLAVCIDITKQKKAENTVKDQLEEIQIINEDLETKIDEVNELNNVLKENEKKLRISNVQKDKFFSLLAHDLRSPVGNFLQISELLKLNYEELTKDQIHDFFDNLHILADKTFKLLDNLLMWSRSQLGKLEINEEKLELNQMVEEVAFLFEENLIRKNIKLLNKIDEDLIVNADHNIIQTILRNLISNAIKFTNSRGTITINNKFEVDYSNNKKYYVISVQDTGIGIPEDNIERVFSADEEYTTLGTDNEKGTGLGLKLCKELIEKTGERMWLGSEVGKGTSFYFTLKS